MPSNSAPAPETGALLKRSPWEISRRVLGALLLRELLTRYGRNNIGFLWLFVEPTVFIIVLTVAWSTYRSGGGGLPIVAFALTGYPSLLLWRSTASRCIGSINSNKPLLFHKQVTITDIFIARIALEIMAISATMIALTAVFYAIGWLLLPEDSLEVIAGWFLLCWFAAGLGLTVGGLSEKTQVVSKVWHPIQYLLMMVSGVAFMVDALPTHTQNLILWVPMINGVEIVREGWFGSQVRAHYDLEYLIGVNIFLTLLGLSLVRSVAFDSREE
jgi:ABC-2 type transport system permease protein/capsular polysaccharide transport system permease protein